MGRVAFVFPGQGSAAVSMGADIVAVSPAATRVLDRLGELAPAVKALTLDGPKEELIRTSNAQPAIFAVNCACLAALEERGIRPVVAAGHSLAEYSALVAADVLDFEAGLRLVIERGALMERSAAAQPGTMVAVLGATLDCVNQAVASWRDRGIVANANDNAPGQIVISGDVRTVAAVADELRADGARARDLPVGGAFHSPLMATAEEAFAPLLADTAFARPCIPVVSNLTAAASEDPAILKAALMPQITGRVRWRESVETMVEMGVDTFVEVGPGKVLSGLIQRCTKGRNVRTLNVEDGASLKATVAALSS
ncbi:MAG: ACP S-malonyltransferase [Chloroflexi bacterium]|nr:ACP S-malonyltransferase [Chloroflexota bacterium]